MTNAIAIRELTASIFEDIMRVAPVVHAAHMFGVSSPEQAAVIMIKGHELNLGWATAFEFIDVISNKPVLSPRGALALIHRSGELVTMSVDEEPNQCRVTMKRRNGFEYTTTFTMDDATKAGLVKKDGAWEKYPKNMLRWRAIGFCSDVVFPDILGGLKRADEFGADIDETGKVVTVQATVIDSTSNGVYDRVPSLEVLVDKWGTEAILAANGGRLPTSNEELFAIEAALH